MQSGHIFNFGSYRIMCFFMLIGNCFEFGDLFLCGIFFFQYSFSFFSSGSDLKSLQFSVKSIFFACQCCQTGICCTLLRIKICIFFPEFQYFFFRFFQFSGSEPTAFFHCGNLCLQLFFNKSKSFILLNKLLQFFCFRETGIDFCGKSTAFTGCRIVIFCKFCIIFLQYSNDLFQFRNLFDKRIIHRTVSIALTDICSKITLKFPYLFFQSGDLFFIQFSVFFQRRQLGSTFFQSFSQRSIFTLCLFCRKIGGIAGILQCRDFSAQFLVGYFFIQKLFILTQSIFSAFFKFLLYCHCGIFCLFQLG